MPAEKKSGKDQSKASFRESQKRPYIVPAVDRAVRILSLLRSEGREMTIAEIGELTGWHKSSVHKLLVTLHYHGLLDRDPATKRYSLGVALYEYGRTAVQGLDVRRAAKPFLKMLVDHSGETAALSILRETQLTLVEVEESPSQIRVALAVGLRAPATTTSNGKAVLAFLPENRLLEILKAEGLPAMTKKSITKTGAYRADLDATRNRGYATDCEEFQEGITGVSAPVFDAAGHVIGALSIAGPAFRMTRDKIGSYGRKCVEFAEQLSSQLGNSGSGRVNRPKSFLDV
jgi:DNA-binding IclR family transcriptional regulator